MSSPQSPTGWVNVSTEGTSSSPSQSATSPPTGSSVRSRAPSPPSRTSSPAPSVIRASSTSPPRMSSPSPSGGRASSPPSRMGSPAPSVIRASSTSSQRLSRAPFVTRASSPPSRSPSRTPYAFRTSSPSVGRSPPPRLVSPVPSVEPTYSNNETTTQTSRHGFRHRRNRFHPLYSTPPRSLSRTPQDDFRVSSPPAGRSSRIPSRLVSPAPTVAATNPENGSTQGYRHNPRHNRRHRFCPPESLYAVSLTEDRFRGGSRVIFDWGSEASNSGTEQSSRLTPRRSSFTMPNRTPYNNSARWGNSARTQSPYTFTAPRTLVDGTLPLSGIQSNEDVVRANRGERLDPFPINRLLGMRSMEHLQRSGEQFTTLEFIGGFARERKSDDFDLISSLNQALLGGEIVDLGEGMFQYNKNHPSLVDFFARLDLEDAMEDDEDDDSADAVAYGPLYGNVNNVLPEDTFLLCPNGRLLIVPRDGREPFQLQGRHGVEYRWGFDGSVTLFPTDGKHPFNMTLNKFPHHHPAYIPYIPYFT